VFNNINVYHSLCVAFIYVDVDAILQAICYIGFVLWLNIDFLG
jgi:hypothetical protein